MIYHWSNSITYHISCVSMSSGQHRRSITYACITRQTPLRKLCGALASRRSIRRAWRARAESCQRPAARFRGEAADPTTSDGAARQTEDVVWRTIVPGTHERAGSYELSIGSFPGNDRASRRLATWSRPAGRRPRRRPRRDVLRSQENNRLRKDADVSYDLSRRASLRREIVPGKHNRNGAGRRRDAWG